MATRKFTRLEAQRSELRRAYDQCKDGRTRTRLQAVRLYGSASPLAQVQEMTGCSRTPLMDWCRRSRSDGLAGLRDARLGGNRAKLTPAQRHSVRTTLRQSTPRQLFGPEAATDDGQVMAFNDLLDKN